MYSLVIKIRSSLLVFLTHHLALPLLKLVRKPKPFPYTIDQLRALPPGTMGYDLAALLDSKQLQLLPYYAKHDIKHLLLQYDTTDEGEVCLQAFMLGNRHYSFPVIATVLYGFFTMPEYWSSFRRAYRRGNACAPIEDWPWFSLLPVRTAALRHRLDPLAEH